MKNAQPRALQCDLGRQSRHQAGRRSQPGNRVGDQRSCRVRPFLPSRVLSALEAGRSAANRCAGRAAPYSNFQSARTQLKRRYRTSEIAGPGSCPVTRLFRSWQLTAGETGAGGYFRVRSGVRTVASTEKGETRAGTTCRSYRNKGGFS